MLMKAAALGVASEGLIAITPVRIVLDKREKAGFRI